MSKRILDLHDELNQMPEFQLLEEIRHFGASITIFEGNYEQLKELLIIHNDPIKSQFLHSVRNREVLHAFQIEVIRLLHNYVAAAFSLVDHTRIHYRKLYLSNNRFPEYQTEIN
ncbi:hypothetical protein [Pontibacter harenae]|uniref:hypothetical protein n=1 Tax=Pontibacter harenae TaxID=2894083 RepID=UPI001E4D5189|nr:hypothetical protein [Pontibacter harenae]MCC9167686.1 hypothetical protein [Pontibacter harenae]